MAEAVEADSPTAVGNDELVEHCLIMIQQLFAEEQISGQERDHLKGNDKFSDHVVIFLANEMTYEIGGAKNFRNVDDLV